MTQSQIIEVKFIDWGSVKYIQSLALRYEVLRKPLGLIFDPAIFLTEKSDYQDRKSTRLNSSH